MKVNRISVRNVQKLKAQARLAAREAAVDQAIAMGAAEMPAEDALQFAGYIPIWACLTYSHMGI